MWSEKNSLMKDPQKINESHYLYMIAESCYPEKERKLCQHIFSPLVYPISFCTPKEKQSHEKVMREQGMT